MRSRLIESLIELNKEREIFEVVVDSASIREQKNSGKKLRRVLELQKFEK